MRKPLIRLIVFPVTAFLFPLIGNAGTPLETIQTQVDDMLSAFRDPSPQGEAANDTRVQSFRSCAGDIFDFAELSRRTLGRDWRKLNEHQRQEFVLLFSALLEQVYIDRILSYTDEKVIFNKEIMISKDRAEVQCDIVTRSRTIRVHYRMLLKNDEWKVYDVIIEGVSMVENYRSQFRRILTNKPPEELIKILRKKVHTA